MVCLYILIWQNITSSYDEIVNHDLKTSGLWEDTSISKETTATKLAGMLDMLGNLDCDKLNNSEYKSFQREDFVFQIPPVGEYVPYEITVSDIRTNIDLILSDAKNNNIKRESIHVLVSQNTFEGVLTAAYRIRKGCGYEYFMYTQGDILPDGIEINTWYKRKFVVEHGENMRTGQADYLNVTYGTYEKLN